ncbi:MAG: hypothetical protein ACRYF0_14805 [Janthinobacterium lividum]
MALTARQNVLAAIPKGQYHSCVLTCYSFDFQFFELQVMRALRAAGVRNVLVLLDGRYMEKLASRSTGLEFWSSSGYSLYPVYVPGGVFHPKLMLLFGRQGGLLTLGSGNLTLSGLGRNDEAWGCFQVADPASPTAALFANAWHYVQACAEPVRGVAAEKLAWIRQFTPWLTQLPAPQPGRFHTGSSVGQVALLTNGPEGILTQALTLVGKAKVERITCLSPYYDQQGLVLQHLLARYPQAQMDCVTEPRWGILPLDLPAKAAGRIAFYRWQDCGARQAGGRSSRLHAKLVQLITSQGEYLLLGSANVTASGLGAGPYQPLNQEASLLLHRPTGNYLTELSIRVSSRRVSLAELAAEARLPRLQLPELAADEATGQSVQLLLAELEPEELTLHLGRPQPGYFRVRLLDVDRQLLLETTPVTLTAVVRVSVPELKAYASVVELRNAADEVVGQQFIQRPAEQYKYCPDPRLEKLQKAFSDLALTGLEGLADLLDLLETDTTQEPAIGGAAASGGSAAKPAAPALAGQPLLPLIQVPLAAPRAILNSPSVRLAELLQDLSRRLPVESAEAAYADSREQTEEADSGADETDWAAAIPNYQAQRQAFERGQRSLKKFLQRLEKEYRTRLQALTDRDAHRTLVLPELTLRDLAVFNVALHVAISYVGRYFTYREGHEEWNDFYLYKSEVDDLRCFNTLKGFCNLLIGGFLLLATGGIRVAEGAAVRRRAADYQQAAFEMVLFLVVHTPWKESERDVRDLLLGNAVRYLRPAGWPLAELPSHLAASFARLPDLTAFAYPDGPVRLQQVLRPLLPRLRTLEQGLPDKGLALTTRSAASCAGGEWVFMRRLGLCQLKRKYPQAGDYVMHLVRPGLPALDDDLRGSYACTLAAHNSLVVI